MRKIIIAILWCLLAVSVQGQQVVTEWPVTLMWDPNTEEDLAGYNIYHASVSFNGVVPYGSAVGTTVAGVEMFEYTIATGGFHYFVATAFDETGNESGPSNEVMFVADNTPPAACSNLSIN
jgi:hypothetical protein